MALKDYVKKAQERGLSKSDIISALKEKGYNDLEIRESFENYQKDERVFGEVNYADKIKMLFSSPNLFFQEVRDPNISKSLSLLAIVLVLVQIVGYGISYIMSLTGMGGGVLNYLGIGHYVYLLSFVLIVLYLIGSFVFAGLINLILMMTDAKGNFVDTYNAVAYAFIVGSIISVVPIIGTLGYIYSLILIIFGISEYHKIPKGTSTAVVLAPILVLVVLFVFLIFYLFGMIH